MNIRTYLSTLALVLSTVLTMNAQTDSIPTPSVPTAPPTNSDISIRAGGDKGTRVEVNTYDTLTGARMDTTRLSIGDKTVIIVDKEPGQQVDSADVKTPKELSKQKRHELNHWNGIDIGWNGFINSDGTYGVLEGDEYLELNQWGSRYISFNFGETKLRLIKDYVGIYTGAAISFNNYKLQNDSSLAFTKDTVLAFNDPSIESFRKNKFRTAWVQVPLMLEFNTSNSQSNNFHLAAGVIGGYNIGNMYKQKIKRDGDRDKNKVKGDLNVEDIKLDAALRIGYKDFALAATYQLTELFQDNRGPELYPVTFAFTFDFD